MECMNTYGRSKVKFNTLDLAIAEAKLQNLKDNRIHKLVAYKCSKCFKYHIGSNGKLLKKEKNIYEKIN
jgi:hypothetical protein